MKLTTKSEYSLLALVYLARAGEGTYVKVEDICERYGISKKYLEQLLTTLKQSGFIRARRGATGGYALAKRPEDISLASVIRIMDGALAPTQSVSTYFFDHTPIEKEPRMVGVFREIRDYIADRMENTKLKDIL
jgi:Rrf2 family transcriptional regulator, cysteine metabolism repressor